MPIIYTYVTSTGIEYRTSMIWFPKKYGITMPLALIDTLHAMRMIIQDNNDWVPIDPSDKFYNFCMKMRKKHEPKGRRICMKMRKKHEPKGRRK